MDKENFDSNFYSERNFHPSGSLPLDCEIAVRTAALSELEQTVKDGSEEKSLSTTERNSLLTIIAALCDYSAINIKELGVANQIAKFTQDIGAAVTDDIPWRQLAEVPACNQVAESGVTEAARLDRVAMWQGHKKLALSVVATG